MSRLTHPPQQDSGPHEKMPLTNSSDQFLSVYDHVEENAVGVDFDAIEMEAESDDEQDIKHLKQGRNRLLMKVIQYKEENEKLKTINAKLIHKHRRELESVRNFYSNISLGLTYGGKVLRSAMYKNKEHY